MIEIQWYVILAAFILDFVLGDPRRLPHPVIYMGSAISFFEDPFRRYFKQPLVSGFFFASFLILSTWLIAFVTIKVSMSIHPVFGNFVQVVLLFFCFSSASLEKAALSVFQALEENNIEKAREKVSYIVGRNTKTLDQKGVTRASVETVAENFVDGFLSPLFFAMIGGVPLAIAYKMVNTLDSMVGYKNDTYILFGRPAARIDDVANFIPARISVLIISLSAALLSFKKGGLALKTGFSQGSLHKSPNAGYPEAAFAGALKIRLGGPNIYHGKLVEKPYIGKEFKDPEKESIKQACDLMMLASFSATLISCFILFI
ncbi:MAG: adenosylcobinamide-phosphate synthase CbiB, partial [Proteobacteria bacterium]|nr:adenosylcobinamide-phosphate synthase CbiB [Pseudomonadota bacterium]